MASKSELIAALVAETRAALNATGWGAESCLPGARVGIDILKAYGVDASALSVTVVAMNPTAASMKTPQDPVKEAMPPPTVIKMAYEGPSIPWSGHCVIFAPNEIVDLTIDQVDQADAGLLVAPAAFSVPTDFADGKKVYWRILENGCRIGYRSLPYDTAFMGVPDWASLDKLKAFRAELEIQA